MTLIGGEVVDSTGNRGMLFGLSCAVALNYANHKVERVSK